MRSGRVGTVAVLCFAVLLMACASKRPVLYPNARYQQVGATAAQRDLDVCLAAAEEYAANPAADIAYQTTKGAAIGGAVGAAAGAVRGHAGTGAGVGAAGAATAGLMRGLFRLRDPDPIEARFVSLCLAEKGYQTLGWR